MATIDDEAPSVYSQQVGERLRVIRKQKRLSLQEVEAQSDQEFKASVLGAYERGERALSVPRLDRLAQFYSVPVEQLLPRYLKLIQVQRQDFNGRVITVRGDDTRSIAAMLDVPVDQVGDRLAALDLLFVPTPS